MKQYTPEPIGVMVWTVMVWTVARDVARNRCFQTGFSEVRPYLFGQAPNCLVGRFVSIPCKPAPKCGAARMPTPLSSLYKPFRALDH